VSPESQGVLDSTAELLRSLGHQVVERDVDLRPRDVPIILGLMFRGIHDTVKDVERPEGLEAARGRSRARAG
jgi:amidase